VNKLVVATKNKGKLKEIKELLKNLTLDVVSMEEVGITDEIDETGATFRENAYIKAMYIYNKTKSYVLADDSGLEVDYLDGLPGVLSARFAGENATDEDRYNKLLGLLKNVPADGRSARFRCSIACITPDGSHFFTDGTCEGMIGFEARGNNGFGYDPIFYINDNNQTIAQLNSEQKNQISHRGKALQSFKNEFKKITMRE
jgi:XTP/dITP diphosphohydrolase